jgi:hypothetical protein
MDHRRHLRDLRMDAMHKANELHTDTLIMCVIHCLTAWLTIEVHLLGLLLYQPTAT